MPLEAKRLRGQIAAGIHVLKEVTLLGCLYSAFTPQTKTISVISPTDAGLRFIHMPNIHSSRSDLSISRAKGNKLGGSTKRKRKGKRHREV